MRPLSFAVAFSLASIAGGARAQTAPPAAPPPAGQPPPGYYAPYPPQPYAYPPPRLQPAPVLPYKEGEPIPAGYHLEEHPRRGLVIAGWIVGGVGYGLALTSAASADFKNESGWLAVPLAGPWLTMGRRTYHCDKNSTSYNSGDCVADIFVVMGLLFDGIVQTAGGTLLLVGYAATKKELVYGNATSLRIRPMRVGSGNGIGVSGTF